MYSPSGDFRLIENLWERQGPTTAFPLNSDISDTFTQNVRTPTNRQAEAGTPGSWEIAMVLRL